MRAARAVRALAALPSPADVFKSTLSALRRTGANPLKSELTHTIAHQQRALFQHNIRFTISPVKTYPDANTTLYSLTRCLRTCPLAHLPNVRTNERVGRQTGKVLVFSKLRRTHSVRQKPACANFDVHTMRSTILAWRPPLRRTFAHIECTRAHTHTCTLHSHSRKHIQVGVQVTFVL